MKLVVGLGNPGRRYVATRHNVGFRVVEALALRNGIRLRRSWRFPARLGRGSVGDVPVAVLEPLTFMNRSGEAVERAFRTLGICEPGPSLIVVYDDLDLPFGRIRVRAAGGAGGHRGLEDIIDILDSQEFARLRFGIGRSESRGETADWVLSAFSDDEEAALSEHIERAAGALELALTEGVTASMNRFNASS